MLRSLLNAGRSNNTIDIEAARKKAKELYEAGQGKYYGTDEETFVNNYI